MQVPGDDTVLVFACGHWYGGLVIVWQRVEMGIMVHFNVRPSVWRYSLELEMVVNECRILDTSIRKA